MQQFPHDSMDGMTFSLRVAKSLEKYCGIVPRDKTNARRMKKEEDIKAAPQKEAPQQAQLIRERASERWQRV